MRRRIRKLRFALWRSGGVDVVVTHAPIQGIGDGEDPAHRGFAAFHKLLDRYKPKYWIHGHVHLNYGQDPTRLRNYGETTVVNATERYVLDIPEGEHKLREHNMLIWKNGEPK